MTSIPHHSATNGSPGPATGWHREAVTAGGINTLAGGWLIVSPLALGYTAGDAIWNAVIVGAVVLSLALGRVLGNARSSWLCVANAAAGVWLLGSAFWLMGSQLAVWNTWFTGVMVLMMAVWSMSGSGDHSRESWARPAPAPIHCDRRRQGSGHGHR